MSEQAKCELCGEPMPEGEDMFKFHGFSGPCPKPPLPAAPAPAAGEAERQAFRAGFMAVWHRDDSWTFNGPSAADKEPAAWAAWETQGRPEARVDADVAALTSKEGA